MGEEERDAVGPSHLAAEVLDVGILTVGQLVEALQERGVEANGQVVRRAFGQREGPAGDGGELWAMPTPLPLR